jgi:hypothetical protein
MQAGYLGQRHQQNKEACERRQYRALHFHDRPARSSPNALITDGRADMRLK